MVEKEFIHKILKEIEKYFIKKNQFRLLGKTYDLILIIPSDKYLSESKYSLILSAKNLDSENQKIIIRDLLLFLNENLTTKEYASISRVNIINSQDPLVRNLKMIFAFREEVIEIKEIPVGGIRIDFAYLIKSLVLDKLIEGDAVTMDIVNEENKVETINAGIIGIDQNFDVIHYTGKGLRTIWKRDMTNDEELNAERLNRKSESFLFENEYKGKIKIDKILRIL